MYKIDNSAMILRIEDKLKELRLPKLAFYEQAGITASSFSLWRKNKNYPSQETLQRMANTLDVSKMWLEYGEIEKAPAGDGRGSDFQAKFDQLDEADKAYISGQIDALLSRHK